MLFRSPAEVAGLLARVCELPLPLVVWTGLAQQAWAPPGAWGGDLRRLLRPGGWSLAWLQEGRLGLGRDLIVLGPEGSGVPGTLGPFLVQALLALRTGSTRPEAALALGQLPYGPIGPMLLAASGPGDRKSVA